MKCPLCNGCGAVGDKIELDIKSLRKEGLSIRQIAKLVKKSSTTVHYHLNKTSSKEKKQS